MEYWLLSISAKKVNRSNLGTGGILVFLSIIGFFMVIPFVYAIIQALKPIEEIYIFPPRFWVQNPTLKNFSMMFKLTSNLWVPFGRYIINSFGIAIICTAFQVVFASMAAYALAKHEFKGKKLIFNIIVLSLLFTSEVVFVPQYILISWLGILDSYYALILPSLAYPLGLYLMRQNLLSFPDSIIEAARIDGAPERRIFWGIIMPNMKSVWMTMIVFSFGAMWNRSDTSYIFSEELKGLPSMLTQLSASGISRAGVGAAATVIMMIPPILIFIFTQSNVIEAMANSGLKE